MYKRWQSETGNDLLTASKADEDKWMSFLECVVSTSLFELAHHNVKQVASAILKMQICELGEGRIFFSLFILKEWNEPM